MCADGWWNMEVGDFVLFVFSRMFGVNIRVYCNNKVLDAYFDAGENAPILHFVYNGFHYDSGVPGLLSCSDLVVCVVCCCVLLSGAV